MGSLLAREGFERVGVNAVAREAGVDKVLIYRYFGGIDGLLDAWAEEGDFWPDNDELASGKVSRLQTTSLARVAQTVLIGHLRALRNRAMTREIMRWELFQKNDLTDALARKRETQGMELLAALAGGLSSRDRADLAAIAAVVHAGLSYLTLRAKTADVYLGVELGTDAGQKRLERAVRRITNAVTASMKEKVQ